VSKPSPPPWAGRTDAIADVFYWEPVGALISTVLSQMILGSRVYAVSSTIVFPSHDLYPKNLASGIFSE
jgi:hypothetical protein